MLNLKNNNTHNKNEFKPIFFNLQNEIDEIALKELLDTNSNILICDELQSQLKELVKIRNPQRKLDVVEEQIEIEKLIQGNKWEHIGLWVFYPWNNKLIHLLSKEEFVEVRTSRNLYKITPDELNVLKTKKIGIIGLSVGQMIALTIAMERVCSEIRIADFDLILKPKET